MPTKSPDAYAASYTAALDTYQALRPRSLQKSLGASSIGLCAAKALWQMTGVEPTDAPTSRAALMGNAIHDLAADARGAFNPKLLIEHHVEATMPSGLVIPGTADEIDAAEPSVTDLKTVATEADLVALRREGSTRQQQFQRQIYYLGALQAGLVPEEGTVRNVWLDRSGQADWVYVEQEAFSMAVIREADNWLSSVMYAAENGEEPYREKHYSWCKSFCEFFTHCRETTEPDLTITDIELVAAAGRALEGRKLEAEGKALVASGKRVLEVLRPDPGGDVVGYACGDTRVRWSWVNRESGGYYALHLDPT